MAATSGDTLLALDGVTRRYGGVCAVDAVSLEVATGERHVVIGPNGAGKTTLFKLISRLEPLSDGRIELFGRDVSRMASHKVARLGLARTYQITQLFPQLRVIENVMLAVLGSRPSKFRMLRSAMGDKGAVRKAEETLERVGLGGLGDALAAELGHGQQRQLEVGLALAGDPKLLLLDEPAAGLSGADRGAIARPRGRPARRHHRAADRARHGAGPGTGRPRDLPAQRRGAGGGHADEIKANREGPGHLPRPGRGG